MSSVQLSKGRHRRNRRYPTWLATPYLLSLLVAFPILGVLLFR